MSTNTTSFPDWKSEVDDILLYYYDSKSDNLPDWDWFAAYEADMSPRDAFQVYEDENWDALQDTDEEDENDECID